MHYKDTWKKKFKVILISIQLSDVHGTGRVVKNRCERVVKESLWKICRALRWVVLVKVGTFRNIDLHRVLKTNALRLVLWGKYWNFVILKPRKMTYLNTWIYKFILPLLIAVHNSSNNGGIKEFFQTFFLSPNQ